MFKITLSAEDKLALLTGLGSNDVKLPRQLITRTDFLDAPDSVVGLPAPIPYGDLTSVVSTTSPPVITGTTSLGAYQSTGDWTAGFGAITSTATPPTATVVTPAASGTLSANVPNAEYGVVVTAIDAAGVESDPYPYYTDVDGAGGRGSFPSSVPKATVNGSQKLQVSWSGGAGASSYRAYLCYYYYGARVQQYIATASTSCEFTTGPEWQTPSTDANITPAADVPTFTQLWQYAVSAIVADGETGRSVEVTGIARFYSRPLRLEWQAVAGATGYRVYKKPPGGEFLFRFDLGVVTAFNDDLTNSTAIAISGAPIPAGLVPAIHVGTRLDTSGFRWLAFLVAGCAIKSIGNLYQGGVLVDSGNYGVTFAVPGKTGFSTYFGANPYADINGHRYTLLYVRGPQGDSAVSGTHPITVTLTGVESVGDGSGTLLTNLTDQYEHWLRNVVLRDQGTAVTWSTAGPTWEDTPIDVDLVDGTSFDTVQATWAARGTAGCPGAWVLGMSETGTLEQQTVRTWIARLNQSLDCYSGFSRKSQYVIRSIDETASLSATPQFTATLGINEGTFEIEDKTDQIENQIVVKYALDAPHTLWSERTVEDVDAQTAIGETKPYTLTLWAVRRSDIAGDIAQRRLVRRKYPYRLVRWECDMGGLTVDLGDTVRVTHPDGAGASGWTDRAVFLLRHEFDPQRFVVKLEGLDLDALITTADAAVAVQPSSTVDSVGADLMDGFLWQLMQSGPTWIGDLS